MRAYATVPFRHARSGVQVLDLLADTEFPGSVLVRMGLGPIHSYIKNKTKWKDEIQGLLRREPYELRVHVYQVRLCWCCCWR